MSSSSSSSSVTQSSGCFNGILRRLLCTGSVPTHPADETNKIQLIHLQKDPNYEVYEPNMQSSPLATPGIVARLMGLDSLPETNWVSKGRDAADLVKRSRSVSFADYLVDFNLNDHDQQQQQHRRVRTSVSFREVPEVLHNHQKSHDFLVVYLDNVDKSKEVKSSKVKKSEVGNGELKEGKKNKEKKRESDEIMKKKKKEKIVVLEKNNKKISKLKDEPRRKCAAAQSSKSKGLGYSVSPCKKNGYKNGGENLKGNSDHHLPLKKTSYKKKIVAEPKIEKRNHLHEAKEDTSPVSVLDIDDLLIQHETWLSGYSIPMDLNSEVNTSPKASYNDGCEMRAAKRKDFEAIKDEDSRDYAELLALKLQKWTEEDLNEANWVAKDVTKFEGIEEICMEFEGVIVDMLLQQAIDEFAQISYGNLWTFNIA